MISDARQKVAEDRRKVAHWRTERSTQLVQVGLLDHRVDLWERAVQEGAAAVVVLLKRQTWQQHEAERAAIAKEAARPMTPSQATKHSAWNPNGSHSAAAVQAGPSRRQPSPPGHPIAASSPVGMRFTGTIPKNRPATSTNSYQCVQEDRSRTR